MNIPVEKRIDIERQIVGKIVEEALKKGLILSVWDGERYAIKYSANQHDIMKELFACDEEELIVYSRDYDHKPYRLGSITLIYGNDGWDVVNNYSWSDDTEAQMKALIDEGAVKELTDKLEKEWS